MNCPDCGEAVGAACAFHEGHRFVFSHHCRVKGDVLVWCPYDGATARAATTEEAVELIGGTFDSSGQVWT